MNPLAVLRPAVYAALTSPALELGSVVVPVVAYGLPAGTGPYILSDPAQDTSTEAAAARSCKQWECTLLLDMVTLHQVGAISVAKADELAVLASDRLSDVLLPLANGYRMMSAKVEQINGGNDFDGEKADVHRYLRLRYLVYLNGAATAAPAPVPLNDLTPAQIVAQYDDVPGLTALLSESVTVVDVYGTTNPATVLPGDAYTCATPPVSTVTNPNAGGAVTSLTPGQNYNIPVYNTSPVTITDNNTTPATVTTRNPGTSYTVVTYDTRPIIQAPFAADSADTFTATIDSHSAGTYASLSGAGSVKKNGVAATYPLTLAIADTITFTRTVAGAVVTLTLNP